MMQTTQVPAVAAMPTHFAATRVQTRARSITVSVLRCDADEVNVNLSFYSRVAGQTFAKTRVALTQWQQELT